MKNHLVLDLKVPEVPGPLFLHDLADIPQITGYNKMNKDPVFIGVPVFTRVTSRLAWVTVAPKEPVLTVTRRTRAGPRG
jgi:hypothetical protein